MTEEFIKQAMFNTVSKTFKDSFKAIGRGVDKAAPNVTRAIMPKSVGSPKTKMTSAQGVSSMYI